MSTTIKTNHVNPNRTGANLTETKLTTQSVAGGQFGRLWRRGVRGAVYAQPLYVPGLQIAGGTHDVVYVATMHNYVYALDANSGATLWGPVPLGAPIPLPDDKIGGGWGYKDISAEIGIISTPEISTVYNVIYVVSTTVENGSYHHRLHALDLATGAHRMGPRDISVNGFLHHLQNQRPGLLKFGDSLFIAFASYGDYSDPGVSYHGWVLKYSAADLAFQGSFNTTPNGAQGGIWMAGQGPAADDSSVYVMTGNGTTNPNGSELSCAIIELDGAGFTQKGFFIPSNYDTLLNPNDLDLGSGGVLVIPDPGADIIIAGGKDGRLFVLQRHALPSAADDSKALQWFYATTQPGDPGELKPAPASSGYHHIHGSPVYWNGPMGRWIYLAGEADYFKAFAMDAGFRFAVDPGTHRVPPASKSTVHTPEASMPGAILALSANGATQGSGVLWAAMPFRLNGNQAVVDGVLYAFDATDLTKVLWHSKMNPARDDVGAYPKFVPPVPVDGKVFLPSLSGPYEKFTSPDTAVEGPALANLNDDRLLLAWAGTDPNNSLNVARSIPSFETSPNGLSFTDKRTLTENSHHSPALAVGNGLVFLAWTGTDPNSSLNVARATDYVNQGFFGKATLPETSPYGPALAFFGGRLYIAWTGADPNHKLNVAWSTDFQYFNKQTFADTSDAGPALCAAGDRLVLAWRGQDPNHSLNVVESLDGTNWDFAHKVTMADSSDFTPGVSLAEALYLVWTGRDPKMMLNLLSADPGPNEIHAFDAKQTYLDTSPAGLALTTYRGRAYLGWTGADGVGHVNVAAITAGQVSAYGLP